MASVTLAGNPITVAGNFLKKGDTAPDFTLTAKDLKETGLKDFAGKRKVLNIVPSLDTPVCQASTRKFNAEAGKLGNTVVLVIAADLPFAMGRFCGAEGLNDVVTLSTFRNRDFHGKYGVDMNALENVGVPALRLGLMTKDLIVIDELGEIEVMSEKFRLAMWECLNSTKPVLASVRFGAQPFTNEIKKLPDTEVVILTKSNYAAVKQQVRKWIDSQL